MVGHSFGGLIALHLCRTAPQRIRKLALLDPSVGLAPGGLHELAHRTLSAPSFTDPEQARAQRRAEWPYASGEAVEDEVADHLAKESDGRWRWRFDAAAVVTACSDMAGPPLVPPPGVPTLLVIAQRAGFVRPEYVQDCRSVLGDSLTVAELDSDHMLYLERPREVGTLLRQFFTGGRDEHLKRGQRLGPLGSALAGMLRVCPLPPWPGRTRKRGSGCRPPRTSRQHRLVRALGLA